MASNDLAPSALTAHVLGTVGEIHIDGLSERRVRKLRQRVLDEIRRLEKVFTVFDDASALNHFRASGEATSAELREVLALAAYWFDESAGAFNPCVGVLQELWADGAEAQVLPTQQVLAAATNDIAEGDIAAATNLNAIAKGWIADRALDAAFAARRPPSAGWISLGGDVVHRGPDALTIGIADPFSTFLNQAPLLHVQIKNQALATSGGTQRHWTIGDATYSHVIDPRSGKPVSHIASATVIADDAATADVLATAVAVLAPAPSLALVERVANASCLLVDADRGIHHSSRWPGDSTMAI